jgi:YesN/AraC family two-component response regulator
MDIETKLLQNMTSKLTVLFVEDDNDLRLETTEILSSLFKEVRAAENGKIGLEKYIEYHEETGEYFDLVISDIMMPKMSGIDMARKIVVHHANQQFIFISAHQDSDYLVNLIDVGVTSFISKPITFDTLKTVLYKNCLQLEGDSLQKGLLHKVLEENDKLKKEIITLKSKL